MKISYLVTCCHEVQSLIDLLSLLGTHIRNDADAELIVLIDKDTTGNEKTIGILQELVAKMGHEYIITKQVKIFENSLNKNYAEHKNIGIQKCSGDWIFQLDGDELPPDSLLGDNLKTFLRLNKDIELYWVARINNFIGVTSEDAAQWGWRLSKSLSLKDTTIVNYPDFQGRIFKRDYPRIKWEGRLHEKIIGFSRYAFLPTDEEYAIVHTKTIEKQRETNIRYNKDFTDAENRGHRPA